VYDYKINWSGIRKMMTSDPQLHRATRAGAQQVKSIIDSRVPVDTGELRGSGRIEDRGVKPVFQGEPRMTWAVAYYARHAAAVQGRTGFMNVGLGRGPKR
jgi:hypothetical protein